MATTKTKDSNPKDAIGITKVPASVISRPVLAELGLAMMEGALKYGRHNYRAIGVRASVYYDAQNRHMDDWWEGIDTDPDSGLSHVTKAIATLVVLRDSMIQGNMDDDRPPPSPAGWQAEMNAKVKDLLARYPDPVAAYLSGGRRGPGRILSGVGESSLLRAKMAPRRKIKTKYGHKVRKPVKTAKKRAA